MLKRWQYTHTALTLTHGIIACKSAIHVTLRPSYSHAQKITRKEEKEKSMEQLLWEPRRLNSFHVLFIEFLLKDETNLKKNNSTNEIKDKQHTINYEKIVNEKYRYCLTRETDTNDDERK